MWDALAALGGGIISGVSSLFGSNKGANKALQAVRETNQANRELAEYSYQKDLDMWERQNEYNSPANQMQRMIDAGLNPNLMYGQGDTGNASSGPSYDAPRMEAYTGFGDLGASQAGQQLMQGLMGYAQVRKTNAEADNIRQNTQNLEVQKQLAELNVINQGILNAKNQNELDTWFDRYRATIANLDSSTVNNFASAQRSDSERFMTDSQRQRFEALTPLVLQQTQTAVKQGLFDLFHLSPAKVNKIMSSSAVDRAMAKLSNYQAKALFNELEYGEKSMSWNMYKRAYDSEMMELEKAIKSYLVNEGVDLHGGGELNALIKLIYTNIAIPGGNFINNLIK